MQTHLADHLEVQTRVPSPKTLDPYDDEHLLHYIIWKKHPRGASKKQVARVLNLVKGNDYQYIDRHSVKNNLIIPFKAERLELAVRAHYHGYFTFKTKLDRLKGKYYIQ